MANNVTANTSDSLGPTFKTTDNAGVHTPHCNVDSLPSFPANTSTTAATFAQVVNTITAANTPEALAASQTLVESVLIQAKKGFNSANTSAVFIGFSATNDSNYLELLPGDSVTLNAPQGKKLDLNLIYIECVTAGDGVTYTSVN